MSQLHRFYVPDLARQGGRVTLPDDERHHAIHVVRVRSGQRVQLFDGEGRWCDAEVAEVGRRKLEVERGSIVEEPAVDPRLALAQAWLNHERSIETIVQHGTALGVDRFVFFRAAHSDRAPHGEDRWRRWAVESCKQCGRSRLPAFDFTLGIVNCLASAPGWDVVIATQHAEAVPIEKAVTPNSRVLLLVGPEGDFGSDELAQARASGAKPVSLGPHTLRSELAAAVAVTLVQHQLGR
jgi:16S rRNA (uracil1498-N3)-methyltransferase